jgi:hypothetical protein
MKFFENNLERRCLFFMFSWHSYRSKLISTKNLYNFIQLFKFKFVHSDWLYLLKYFENSINFMIKIKI